MGSELYVPEVMSVAERAVQTAQEQMAATLARLSGDDVIGQVLIGQAPKKIVVVPNRIVSVVA